MWGRFPRSCSMTQTAAGDSCWCRYEASPVPSAPAGPGGPARLRGRRGGRVLVGVGVGADVGVDGLGVLGALGQVPVILEAEACGDRVAGGHDDADRAVVVGRVDAAPGRARRLVVGRP